MDIALAMAGSVTLGDRMAEARGTGYPALCIVLGSGCRPLAVGLRNRQDYRLHNQGLAVGTLHSHLQEMARILALAYTSQRTKTRTRGVLQAEES
jgi:hypothetical protein